MLSARYAVATHGYGGYTAGCRCEVCKAAKAAYMRRRRDAGQRRARIYPGDAVWGVKHPSRYAYDERGCRCDDCSTAALAWKRAVA